MNYFTVISYTKVLTGNSSRFPLFLYVNVIMKTMAVADIPSTQLYPTLQGANLIASAICASIFFKEKMTKKSIVGISVALAAAILMNI